MLLDYILRSGRDHDALKDPTMSHTPLILRVTICGGGNVAQTAATYLAGKPGLDVRVLTRRPEAWERRLVLLTKGSSWAFRGEIPGTVSLVSSLPEDVIPMANVILIASPASSHLAILTRIQPYVTRHTVVGCLFAQGGFDWVVRKAFNEPSVLDGFFGFQNVPWICKTVIHGKIAHLIGPKKKLVLSCWPVHKQKDFARLATQLFDIPCITVPNFLCLTLSPSNQLIHPARYSSIFRNWDGASSIPSEHIQKGLYTDFDDESSTLLSHLDQELQTIKAALLKSCPELDLSSVLPVRERILSQYGSDITDPSSLKSIIRTNQGYSGCITPISPYKDGYRPALDSRLFWEDIPFGLCVLKSIAQMVNVLTPTMDTMIRWHQKHMGKEYLRDNGTLNPSILHETGAPETYGILTVSDLVSLYRTTG